MRKGDKKSAKMTVDKLAVITQREFVAVRTEMATEFAAVRTEMAMNFQDFEIKITDKMKKETVTILHAFDTFATRFDTKEKDEAAHTILHKRISDTLHNHDTRLKKIEMKG